MKKCLRVYLVGLLVLSMAFMTIGCPVPVQVEYPTRAITLVVPWGAGGGTDRIARALADRLSAELGQPVVPVNRTGGHGAVGHSVGAFAAPDGYTLTISTWELSILQHMGWAALTYKDVRGVALLNFDAAGLLVLPSDAAAHGWQDATDWIAHVKQNPGLEVSGTGSGGVWHVALLGMLAAEGIGPEVVKWLPSVGAAEGITWLLGGHIDAVTCSIVEAGPQIKAGTLTPLGIMRAERLPAFPDIPTLKELGIDWEFGAWRGITVPKDTPDEIVQILHDAIKKIIDSQEWKTWMSEQGFGEKYLNSADFDAFMARAHIEGGELLRAAGLIK